MPKLKIFVDGEELTLAKPICNDVKIVIDEYNDTVPEEVDQIHLTVTTEYIGWVLDVIRDDQVEESHTFGFDDFTAPLNKRNWVRLDEDTDAQKDTGEA